MTNEQLKALISEYAGHVIDDHNGDVKQDVLFLLCDDVRRRTLTLSGKTAFAAANAILNGDQIAVIEEGRPA